MRQRIRAKKLSKIKARKLELQQNNKETQPELQACVSLVSQITAILRPFHYAEATDLNPGGKSVKLDSVGS